MRATGGKMNEAPPTQHQLRVLGLIYEAWEKREPCPTVRELMAELSVASTNAVACVLRALEEKGLLESPARKNRSRRITDAGRAVLATTQTFREGGRI